MISRKGQIENAIRRYEEGEVLRFGGVHQYGLRRNIRVLVRVNHISGNLANANVSIRLPNGQRVRYSDHFYDISSLDKHGLLKC